MQVSKVLRRKCNFDGSILTEQAVASAHIDWSMSLKQPSYASLSGPKHGAIATGFVLSSEAMYRDSLYDVKLVVLVRGTNNYREPVRYTEELWFIQFQPRKDEGE